MALKPLAQIPQICTPDAFRSSAVQMMISSRSGRIFLTAPALTIVRRGLRPPFFAFGRSASTGWICPSGRERNSRPRSAPRRAPARTHGPEKCARCDATACESAWRASPSSGVPMAGGSLRSAARPPRFRPTARSRWRSCAGTAQGTEGGGTGAGERRWDAPVRPARRRRGLCGRRPSSDRRASAAWLR